MSEQEPTINLKIGSQEFLMTPSNSELYHYMGALAIWNHVFIQQEEADEVRTGVFVPQALVGEEVFTNLGDTMSSMGFPMRLNMRSVSESDIEIITKIIAGKDLEEGYPDWLK